MKALTNILNYMLLMLLLMLVACTHDDAEVENLSHGDKYVSVRMHVPGMKSSFSRAAEDSLTSIVALVFRDDVLISNTEVLDLTPNSDLTGTFKIPQPNKGDIIHFLGNLPETVKSKLPKTGDSQTEVLRNLETDDFSNLSYWGMATYFGGDIDVTLYRNMAKVEIAAGPNCTFRDDELYIAGLVKPIGKGTLVPYQDGFTFNLKEKEYDYYTLPNDTTGKRFNNLLPTPVKSLYIFEHDNPGTADGLYIICKIGETGNCYYKVALIDENKEPYPIIRNHRYVIYVDDLDEGADSFEAAVSRDPINFDVVEYEDVTLTLTPKANTLYYNNTSEEAITVTVGDIDSEVETLTFTAPAFSILSDYAVSEGNGVFRITDRTKSEINFTLTLVDPNQTGSVSVTAAGEYVNSSNTASTNIQLTERAANSGETIMWQGAVEMHNNNNDGTTHAGKVLIPYSFFFDVNGTQKIPVNSTIRLEYNGSGYIQTYLFKDGEASIWNISESIELTLTQELLNKIKESHTTVWGVDAAFVFEGGNGAVLKKVTLIPAKESITATADKTQLYYDSNDAQVVTVNVTVPNGVETLKIEADDFTVSQNGTPLTDDDSDGFYTYTVIDATNPISFVFTLNKANFTADRVSTITFSDASSNVFVENGVVVINVEATSVQGKEIVIYGVDHDPLETGIISTDNEKPYLLLDKANAENKAGNAEAFRKYFTPGATIIIEFICNVTEKWHIDNLRMEIGTTWTSARFTKYNYKKEDNNKPEPLSYTFSDNDFGADYTDTVNGAGLKLMLRFVTVTKISIIPAPTTK